MATRRNLLDTLNSAGKEFREDLEHSSEMSAPPGADRLEEVLRRQLSPRPMKIPWSGWVSLAATLTIIAFFAGHALRSGDPDPVVFLGPDDPVATEARGFADDYSVFSFVETLPPGGVFEVFVFDTATGAEIVSSGPRTGGEWQPENTSSWPDEIRWELTFYDASGIPVGNFAGTASRQRR